MKKDYFNTFEENDFRVCADMEFDYKHKNMLIPLEAWFDTDKKFGINAGNDDNVWVNVSVEYNPAIGDIIMSYEINDENGSQSREYIMTAEERSMVLLIHHTYFLHIFHHSKNTLMKIICIRRLKNIFV